MVEIVTSSIVVATTARIPDNLSNFVLILLFPLVRGSLEMQFAFYRTPLLWPTKGAGRLTYTSIV